MLFAFLSGCTSVNVTGINLNVVYAGISSGYLGTTSQSFSNEQFNIRGGDEFSYTLNLQSNALLLTHSINGISANDGFIVESVTPSLPYSFSPGSSMIFKLKIKAPDQNFDGPMTIVITTS